LRPALPLDVCPVLPHGLEHLRFTKLVEGRAHFRSVFSPPSLRTGIFGALQKLPSMDELSVG
jgi:hypothetical protein